MDHAAAIALVTRTMEAEEEVRALFLSGSHANGTADAFSDLDFVAVTRTGATDETAALCRRAVEKLGEIVLWRDRIVAPVLVNAVTEDWNRVDVLLLKPDQTGRQTRAMLRPLFDRDGIFDTLAEGQAHTPTPSPRLAYAIDEFLRILGLLHLVVGRGEWINGVTGWFLLRGLLMDLMIEDTAAPHRGGALHLNRLTTEPQRAALAALPTPRPERESLIDAHLAIAAVWRPLARRIAEARGIPWPAALEDATWRMLGERCGLARPA